jgi:hypothetical protein
MKVIHSYQHLLRKSREQFLSSFHSQPVIALLQYFYKDGQSGCDINGLSDDSVEDPSLRVTLVFLLTNLK